MNAINQYNSLITVILLLLLASSVHGDERSYVWTYEYKTMESGMVEFEHYLTFSSPDLSSFEGQTSTEHNFELEIGMNDRFDFAIYQVFYQAPDAAFKYKGYKLRFRYRLGEKDRYLLDPLLYFEYKGKPDFSQHELESKLILAKDIGRLNFAINPVFEIEFEGRESEKELKYNAGVSYSVNRLLKFGMEVRGGKNGHYIGPVISHGQDGVWVAFGSAFAVTTIKNQKPEAMLRMIIGIDI